jgi:hypothetical protein
MLLDLCLRFGDTPKRAAKGSEILKEPDNSALVPMVIFSISSFR